MADCDHKFVGSNRCLKCGWEPPKQITFTDEYGNQWLILSERIEPSVAVPDQRDATPDDLLRAGYVLLSDVQVELREALKPMLKAIDEARK
jgi:hypothetical protein